MGKQKSARPTSPQIVATLSSLLLLLVACSLGFYFMELRGPGVRTLLSGSQASEVLVLLGGLAAIVLTGHLAVANAARSTQGTAAYRKLIRRAAEVDCSDPDVLNPFGAVPELRDLVAVLVAEKQQGRQLQDALESVRGEHQGLLAGMERSLTEGGRMRQDHPSELGREVATLWNSLIERIEENDTHQHGGEPRTTEAAVGADTNLMEARLRELEERVAHLQSRLGSSQDSLLVTDDDAASAGPLLMPETSSDLVDVEDEDLDPISPLLVQDDGEVADAQTPEGDSAPGAPPQSLPSFDSPQEPDAVDEGVENTFAPPREDATTMFNVPWREHAEGSTPPAPVAGNGEPTQGDAEEQDESEPTYSEWGGASFASLTADSAASPVGFGKAPEKPTTTAATADAEVGFGSTVHGSASDVSQEETVAATPSQGPSHQDSTMRFPEFAAPKRQDSADHVEVTYHGSTQMEADDEFAFGSPTREAFVEDTSVFGEDDEVVDLKSLGAMETNE